MSSEIERIKMKASLTKIEHTTYEEETRPYSEVLLERLAEAAALYGWQWTSDDEGTIFFQRGKHTISFSFDPLDDNFAGGVLTTQLYHDLDMFSAMRQLGADNG